MELFPLDIPKNNDPIENLEITTTILFMSKEELKEFKKLCKEGMKQMFPETFQEKANLPDFLLTVLREKYSLN